MVQNKTITTYTTVWIREDFQGTTTQVRIGNFCSLLQAARVKDCFCVGSLRNKNKKKKKKWGCRKDAIEGDGKLNAFVAHFSSFPSPQGRVSKSKSPKADCSPTMHLCGFLFSNTNDTFVTDAGHPKAVNNNGSVP